MLREFYEELGEEVTDFFEDFREHVTHQKPTHPTAKREMVVNGVTMTVRPAYIFAERIDNLLKIIFGGSIIISAFTSSFLGFTKLSDLLDVLIFTFWGRMTMVLIGASYLIIASWKLMHLGQKE